MARRTWTEDATIGDLYSDAMKVETKDEAAEYLEALVQHMVTYHGQTRDEATQIQLQNLGYFAGYYDQKTMSRVNELFDTSHPIFGQSTPTAEEAIELGQVWAKGENDGD